MGKKSAPSSDPRIGAAAEAAQKISGEEWDWFKNTYLPAQMENQQGVVDTSQTMLSNYLTKLLPSQEQAFKDTTDAAQQTSQTALKQMSGLGQTGDQMMGLWSSSYMPIYSQIASEAAAKGGKADQDYQAMLAQGDVSQAYANAAGKNDRYLASYGMSPTSGVAQSLNRSAGLSQAASEAAAQTAARQAASNLGWTYRQQAAEVGNNLLNAGTETYKASQQSGLNAINANTGTLNAGNALGQSYAGALNVAGAPLQSYNTIAGGLAGGAQGATGGYNASTGGLAAQQASQSQAAAANASGTGQIVGSALGAAGMIAAVMI